MQYFTGSKEHNVKLRRIAISKGLKLNEYGLFSGKSKVGGRTEKQVYEKLAMSWIPPEMRENSGEIEKAQKKQVPSLIHYNSLKGDLQMHTDWSDGYDKVADMAEAAKKMGLEYVAITDHSKRLSVAGGLDEKGIKKQSKEIEKVNDDCDGIKVLKGIEVDVLKDGRLDLPDSALKGLDIVGASVHSHFTLTRSEQTRRILQVLDNENVDILFHPTGRLIQKRDPVEADYEKMFERAKENNTILEIDAHPGRLDLEGEMARMARDVGCKFAIDSDAHTASEFGYLKFGIGQARRGWLEENKVVNTYSLKRLARELKNDELLSA